MHSAYRNGALILALIGFTGLAASHYHPGTVDESVGIGEPYAAIVDDFNDEVTGSIGQISRSDLRLSDEERGFVFLGVINLPDVPDVDMPAPRLAEMLPETVALRTIPAMVTRKIPALARYRFVKLDDRILLVSAGSREVVAAIPRYKLMVR
ncbi:MAG: DUF1236 domain-containing protein [Xanthobacteraceae bacterium]